MSLTLKKIIETSHNIVFFGGAGVSTESGIADFRSTDGLYSQKYKYPPEIILSHSFFVKNPAYFYDFYKSKMLYPNAVPNNAHTALAALEKVGKLKAVVTQNIDALHQKAGSKNVLELHGSVYRNYCTVCHKFYDIQTILQSKDIPRCTCGGIIKPDVVLYEESLDYGVLNCAIDHIRSADVLIIAGTSLSVYPAASLTSYFRGENLVLINKTETPADASASLVLYESVGKALSPWSKSQPGI